MPELPEVETMRRGIAEIVGARIRQARRTPCAKKPIRISPRIDALDRRIKNQAIAAVERLGKRVVIRLENGDRLILEPRMTGLVLVGEPPNREHLRFAVSLDHKDYKQLLFWDRRGLGNVALMTEKQYLAKLSDGTLGPDALEIGADQLQQRLVDSNREIKVALLDQSVVLGVGNIYASELLHFARVHPQTRCNQVSSSQWQSIHRCMLDVLQAAIRAEGSTLSDGTYRNALNDPGSYQNHHAVYDRAGQTCTSCRRGRVQRIVQAQRATFFCSACQSKGRAIRRKK